MPLSQLIQRAFVINLPTRVDRRRFVLGELDRIGIRTASRQCEVFDAIRPGDAAGFESIGAHGCFMSHLSVLKKARAEGLKHFMVCEDDLLITRKYPEYEPAVLRQLQTLDWDVVFLGHAEPTDGLAGPRLVQVPHDKHMILLHMYLVNGRILDRLIPFLESMLTRPVGDPRGGPMHVDGALSVFRERNPDVKVYRVEPILGLQRGSRSDIAIPKWYDQLPVIRDVAGMARELRTRFSRN